MLPTACPSADLLRRRAVHGSSDWLSRHRIRFELRAQNGFTIWPVSSEMRGARRSCIPLRKSRFMLADVFRYVARQSKPTLTPVTVGNVFEKVLIQLGSVFRGTPPAIEIHVVGMNDHQR